MADLSQSRAQIVRRVIDRAKLPLVDRRKRDLRERRSGPLLADTSGWR